jgi:hypothetical protein
MELLVLKYGFLEKKHNIKKNLLFLFHLFFEFLIVFDFVIKNIL